MANFLYEKHFLISRIVLKIIKIIKKSKKLFYIWKISPSRIVFEQQLKIFKFIYLLSPPSFKSKIFLSEASHLLDLRDNILFISRYRFRNFEIFNVLRLLVPLVSNPEKDIYVLLWIYSSRAFSFSLLFRMVTKPERIINRIHPFWGVNLRTLQAS